MKNLISVLFFALFSGGCYVTENPAVYENQTSNWITVFSQEYSDSVYCENGVSGYREKIMSISEHIQFGDTVKINFDYSYTGIETVNNTLKLTAVTHLIGMLIYQVPLFTVDWIPAFKMAALYPSNYTINKFVFSVYLKSGEAVRFRNIKILRKDSRMI